MKKKTIIGLILIFSLCGLTGCNQQSLPLSENMQTPSETITVSYYDDSSEPESEVSDDPGIKEESKKSENSKQEPSKQESSKPESSREPEVSRQEASKPESSKAPESSGQESAAVIPQKQNSFYNPDNVQYSVNTITISPAEVYYNGDTLVAVCNVYNGFDHVVYDITVDSLSFSNYDGLIAEANFGLMKGLTLSPGQVVKWNFVFSADAVKRYDADLNHLYCKYSNNNKY